MAGVVIASSTPAAEGILADLIIEIIEDMGAGRLTVDVRAVRRDTRQDAQQVDMLDPLDLVAPRQRGADPMPHPRMVARVMPPQHMVAGHTATRTNNR